MKKLSEQLSNLLEMIRKVDGENTTDEKLLMKITGILEAILDNLNED